MKKNSRRKLLFIAVLCISFFSYVYLNFIGFDSNFSNEVTAFSTDFSFGNLLPEVKVMESIFENLGKLVTLNF